LLIGGKTYSSATLFTSAFQCFHAGKIIGTETGGLTVCYGDVYTFLLPNTKYNMRVSYKKFFNAGGIDNGRGIIPDYVVGNSFEDDRRGIDRVMEYTVQLIEQRRN
jgi:C-terminal processing protease CtpA/Prc